VVEGLAAADLVAAPTRAVLDDLRESYAWNGLGMVVPNGRSVPVFRPGTKENLIFAAGRIWDEAKNLSALDAVAAALPWPVEVAGDDSNSVTLPNVTSLGFLPGDGVARKLAQAAIYCLPARYEPFGLSALEAALNGCALVLGDIPSLREVWNDAAVFVRPDDHGELRATLQRLISDQRERSEWAERAQARATRYTPAEMARRYLRAYGACLTTRQMEAVA
jgi:glycosyltransferase involved in cell wall biosynthesis